MKKTVKFISKLALFFVVLFIVFAILMGVWAEMFNPSNITRPPSFISIISIFVAWFFVYKKKIIDKYFEPKNS